MPASKKQARLWEVDTLRGMAIVLMVFYHFVWDLSYFGLVQIYMLAGPWQFFARSIASIFIFVMGVSLTLSYNRAKMRRGTTGLFKKYFWRGGQIFGLGLIITAATYFFIGRGFVIFGILHLLGASIILAYPFLRWNKWASLIAGVGVITLGVYVDRFVVTFPWLIWLGIKQAGVYMVDFYPLLPWFGPALLGVFVGFSVYPAGQRVFTLPDGSELFPVRGLQFLGRHSLLIYLLHQPLLIGVLMLLGYGAF